MFRPGRQLYAVRGFSTDGGAFSHGALHYPALSVPIGQADELVCSPNHVEFLREKLDQSQPLHPLMIGYSGNDREVMALIRESGRGIKTLTVVDRSEQAAEAVIGRLKQEHGVSAEFADPYAGSFDDFVRTEPSPDLSTA